LGPCIRSGLKAGLESGLKSGFEFGHQDYDPETVVKAFIIKTTIMKTVVIGVIAGAVALAAPLEAQCPDGSRPPCAAPRTATASAPAPNSVAVLYFDSRDTADAFLAEGVSEEIATSLGKVPRLVVKIPSAVRRVQRASAGDVRAIGRALNVRWVVDGSLRRSGEQLRVSVRLVDAERETAAWSNAFTRTTRDLLAIQEEIAREVATGVVGALTPVERAAVTARPTTNAQAYEHYLKGNWYMGRRGQWLVRAIDEYRAAARLDPGFGEARAGIALAYISGADYAGGIFLGRHPDSLRNHALALADSVIQSDASVALAWVTRGATLRRMNRFTAARQSLDRAIALDPNSPEAHYRLGQLFYYTTDFADARVSLLRALALDPARPVTYGLLGAVAYFERRYADAERLLDSALVLDPGYRLVVDWQAVVYHALGDTARAEAAVRRRNAMVLADRRATGDTTTRATETFVELGMVGHSSEQGLAQLGRYEEAFGRLERLIPLLVPRRIMQCRHIVRDPAFDPVRRDPRFQRFETACMAVKEPQ
jgi:TolB-like protein/tetratricopeptide (TPR) repeat protein